MEDAYDSMHWSSLVLVAGMLPLADALGNGGTDLIVSGLLAAVGHAGPHTLLTVLFFLTASLSLFLSNTAATQLYWSLLSQSSLQKKWGYHPIHSPWES